MWSLSQTVFIVSKGATTVFLYVDLRGGVLPQLKITKKEFPEKHSYIGIKLRYGNPQS